MGQAAKAGPGKAEAQGKARNPEPRREPVAPEVAERGAQAGNSLLQYATGGGGTPLPPPRGRLGASVPLSTLRLHRSGALPGRGGPGLQRHLRSGSIQAKLSVGGVADPAEREADRVAEEVMSGGKAGPCACGGRCPNCKGGATLLRRKPVDGAGETSAPREAFGGRPGRGLDVGARQFFEPRFGDLSGVRVHHDLEAAATARDIGARAFTAGAQIGFAEGEFAPHTERGRRLLAHELAHVVQNGGGDAGLVRRQPTPGADAPQPGAPPGPTHAGVLHTDHAGDFDPCSLKEGGLTNYALVAEMNATATYLRGRKRGEDKYYDYANLMRRLARERSRRIGMGHAWLGDVSTSFPSTLYKLTAGENGSFIVETVSADQHADAAANTAETPLMTPGQFNTMLERNHIPQVDVEAFYRMTAEAKSSEKLQLTAPPPPPPRPDPTAFLDLMGSRDRQTDLWGNATPSILPASGALVSPFDLLARGNLTRNVYSQRVNMNNPRSTAGAELNWRGGLPEQAFGGGSYADVWNYSDLNKIRRNFEVLDFSGRGGMPDYVSATHSAVGNPDWYGTKFSRMTGAEQPAKFNTAIGRLNTAFGTNLTGADINQSNQLAVPDDHIPMAQAEVNRMVTTEPQRVSPMLNVLLQAPGGGVTVGGVTYTSWNQVQAARSNGTLAQADYATLLANLSPRAQGRVVGIGMTLPEIMEMQRIRVATQRFGPGEFSAIAPPEVLEVRRIMATGVGESEAISRVARSSAARGVAVGTGVSAAIGGFQYLASGADSKVGRDVLMGLPVQAAGNYAGAYATSQWNSRLAGPLLNEAVAGTGTALVARGAVIRIGGGGAIGGPLAALTLWGQMGVQELAGTADYTDIDYLSMGTRALVAGGIAGMASEAGALGFAAYCAAAGTPEAPGVGTAIGFVVGLGAYFVIDYAYGDEIEAAARESLGELGCVKP